MDLIYADSQGIDQGVLEIESFDLAFGKNENDLQVTVPIAKHVCSENYKLYIEDTEYGGIIDQIKVDTSKKSVVYSGRTWQGIIEKKIIMPLQDGESGSGNVTLKTVDSSGNSLVNKYLILSGDANDILGFLIARMGLSNLFSASGEESGFNVTNYKFDRFIDGYSGIVKMLEKVGAKLHIDYIAGSVVLSAVAIKNYSTDEELDSDLVDFTLDTTYNHVNHLVCLGSGELDQRLVIHLYADSSGNISQVQTLTGVNEIMLTYDNSNIETEEELIQSGTDALKDQWKANKIAVNFNDNSNAFDIGDVIKAIDHTTGIAVTQKITKKIIKISNGKTTISYKIGDE